MRKWVRYKFAQATDYLEQRALTRKHNRWKHHQLRRRSTILRQHQRACNDGIWFRQRIHIPRQLQRRLLAWHAHAHLRAVQQYDQRLAHSTMIAMESKKGKHNLRCSFDTDSGLIGASTRASACLSNKLEDFVSPPTPCNIQIMGYGGTRTKGVSEGTIQWSWLDDTGQKHTFLIPNSYYVPHGKCRLLSPQHWAQEMIKQGKSEPSKSTGAYNCVLTWRDGKHRKTILVDRRNNTFTFSLAPGYSRYHAFCAEAGIDDIDDVESPLAMDATMVSDDEESDHSVSSVTYH